MLKRMTDDQLINVLAALGMHISDRVKDSVEQVAEHGAAGPTAIVVVWQHPGETIEYLRSVLSLSHSGTVRLVERLIKEGLIRKRQGEDARSVALTCTAAGKKRAKAILKARQDAVSPLLDGLTEADRRQFGSLLRKLKWSGISSKAEGVSTCRLCSIEVCYGRGNCPVTLARLVNASTGNRSLCKRIANDPYDPRDPDASMIAPGI